MELEFLKVFMLDHVILGNIIVFSMMLITNIFPIMFFVLPDISIFLGIFIANKISVWYVPYVLLIIGAFLGECISYFLGCRYGEKILKHKLLQKDIITKWIKKLKKHKIKTLIIGKLMPGVMWFMPILSGALKVNPILFSIINFIMIVYSISLMFFVGITGLDFLEKHLGEYVWYILFIIMIVYIFYHIHKIKKK